MNMQAERPTRDELIQMIRAEDRSQNAWLASLTNRLMTTSAANGETLADRKALSRRIQSASMQVIDEDLARPVYRQSNETPRCEFCGGSDIHTAGCWSQRAKVHRARAHNEGNRVNGSPRE